MILASGIGIPAAFFTIALPGMMRDGGASLMQIGLIYLVWLPSVLKFFWAPRVARFAANDRNRRRAVHLLTVAMALCFLPVAWLITLSSILWLLPLAVLSAALGLTLHLILADWCINSLDDRARGRANGLIAAGMVLGGVIGGGTVPALAQSFGWAPVIWVLAGLIALTGLAGRALGDTKNLTPPEHVTLRGGARVFLFSEGRFLLAAVALIASTGAVDMTLAARLVDAGFSPERAAIILGTIATILMTPATLFAGYAVSRWNPASCFAAIGLSKAAILAALSLLQQSSGILIATLAVAEFVCAGALTVMTWQFYMARVDSKSGLTGFALLTSTDALFRLGLGIGAGLLGAAIGMGALFLTVAGLNLLTAIYIVRIWRQNA